MTLKSDHALSTLSPEEALETEDRLWWVNGRKAIIQKYLHRASTIIKLNDLVDVGCGSGGNLATLAQFGSVTGIEPLPSLAEAASKRNIAKEVLALDIFSTNQTQIGDLISLFDVLEHIEEELPFLNAVQRLGRPGHLLLMSVPASPRLYSRHDELLNHYRRYSRRHLMNVLDQSGYEVLDCRPFMFFLYPLAVISRFAERIRAMTGNPATEVNQGKVFKPIATIFEYILAAESTLGFGPRFPCGLWLFALAKSRNN